MTNTTNLMSITPNQPASSSPRTTSTQPRYKPAARQARKNFGATFDAVKKGVQDLQDSTKNLAQIETDAKQLDAVDDQTAQGKSETPQDAPQQEETLSADEIKTLPEDKTTATKSLPKEEPPADISLPADENFVEIKNPDVPVDVEKLSDEIEIPDAKNFVETKPPVEKNILDDTADTQPPENFFAANSMAYLFGMNAASLLNTKPVAVVEPVQVVAGVQEVQSAQNLMTIVPQTSDNNAQSMLNMLGGRSWRVIQSQPTEIPTQPLIQTQPTEIPTQPVIQSLQKFLRNP